MRIAESHQSGKTDVSGTAISIGKNFNEMGAVLDENGILSIRDPKIQKYLCGIPKEHLARHGHHEYVLVSNDETVHLALVHNIDGRTIYADGTIKALRFMAFRLGAKGRVYSMIDVLKRG